MAKARRVTCPVCSREVGGYIARGGGRDDPLARKHNRRKGETCPGSGHGAERPESDEGENHCQNCGCVIPRGFWACGRCIAVFDGDEFINAMLDDGAPASPGEPAPGGKDGTNE